MLLNVSAFSWKITMSIYILSKTEKKLWGNPKNEKLIYNSIGLKLLHWGRLRQSILKY